MEPQLLKLVIEFYKNLDRQGPGSEENTLRALGFIPAMGSESRILDIGCGTGAQTLVLASALEGRITAVDNAPEFLKVLDRRAGLANLGARIDTICASMEDLPFDNQTFDLIWAEGSIYNIGFEHGFRIWKRCLKPDGFIAVSEISWLSIARPEELTRYWEREYPGINTISGNLKHIENAGYTPLAVFVVNEDCWQEHFYEPISAALDDFRKSRPEDDTMNAFLEMHYLEIEMFSKYKDYFGYAFYIAGNRA